MNLRKSTALNDWYLIESNGPQPEGTADEWRQIIASIRAGQHKQPGRRVGVSVYPDHISLYSPRNCTDPADMVRITRAELPDWLAAAEQVLAT